MRFSEVPELLLTEEALVSSASFMRDPYDKEIAAGYVRFSIGTITDLLHIRDGLNNLIGVCSSMTLIVSRGQQMLNLLDQIDAVDRSLARRLEASGIR
jgi:hypothetical protein